MAENSTDTATVPLAEGSSGEEIAPSEENKDAKTNKKDWDSTETAEVAAVKPMILPQYREDGKRNYAINQK